MSKNILALVALLGWSAGSLRANDLRYFDDAALHAVQFVDRDEGWAVGDDGVVWHTIDGGKLWERQPTGVRASLRSVCFLNPYTGWIAGREELAQGAGSAGVLLFTMDGGITWKRVANNTMPGLNVVRFLDAKIGFVAGDGSEQFPSGLFQTTDSGRTWKPVAGQATPGWLTAEFQDSETGVLGGPWSRLGNMRDGKTGKADVDIFGGRSVRGVRLKGQRGVAVGQGGLLLVNANTNGTPWRYGDLKVPSEVRLAWDFHAVGGFGDQVWIAGRPGSALLHSADGGENWEIQTTGQPLPLNGLYFVDERRGWAVGEFGSILGTADGGKTWTVQRRGGQRAAVLFVHARSLGVPLDTIAYLAGQEGYLTTAVRANAADPASAAAIQAAEPQRFAAALRQAGGAAGEVLWPFPLPQHLAHAPKRDLIQAWNRQHADRAADEFLRQLVLTLRTWRPNVVVTDHPDEKVTGCPADALVAEAVREAFLRAGDPKAFPEQIDRLGLQAWQPVKLYAQWESRAGAQVVVDGNEVCYRLQATPRDFAAGPAGLLLGNAAVLPGQRYYRLLESRLEGGERHKELLQGVLLAEGGTARRELTAVAELSADVLKAIQTQRNLQALTETQNNPLMEPAKVLANVGQSLSGMADDRAAQAAFALGGQMARFGQWEMAEQLFELMGERYPAHPLTAEAYRWLIRYHTSSEARRRRERNQFIAVGSAEIRKTDNGVDPSGILPASATISGGVEAVQDKSITLLKDPTDFRKGNERSLELGKRMLGFGPLFAADPSVQFCLQAARRNLGDFEGARLWYQQYRGEHPTGPWHDAAESELWLMNRIGRPPKPAAICKQIGDKPFLDGNFDDPCWEGIKPMVLSDAVNQTAKESPTEVQLAYDKDFLYLALTCRHAADRYVPPVKKRTQDADLRAFDRVSLMFDLDRDYATYFHFQVDQRGCVAEDCWGDKSWNPRWFVAVKSEPTQWRIEAVIPLGELTGDPVTVGRAWACNVVRVLPGRGVQAWSQPADVQPRPEGMGLLVFTQDAPDADKKPSPKPVPPKP